MNRLSGQQLDTLREMIGDDSRVFIGEQIHDDYTHDELGGAFGVPEVVIRVLTTEEVSSVMRFALANGIPVTPRGAGTGLVGAAVAIAGGILLDMSLMNQFGELDADNLTLTVEPGVLLMEISSYVEERGFFYPPDPGEKSATIGGNVSTNAGGMRAVKYGVTRDYVRGLEVVLPSGEIVELGGKVVKNSSGYSLKDLMIGSEGTLGIITKITLKLLPLPANTLSLLIPFPSLQAAIRTVPVIVRSKCAPTAIEFMEREVILDAETYLGKKFPDHSADAYLLLKFDGSSAEDTERTSTEAAELCLEQGALDVFISDTQEREESIWSARGAFLEAIRGSTDEMDEVDVVVPRSCVSDMVEYIHALQAELGARIKSFGHAGDGNLHAYILRDGRNDEQWSTLLRQAMDSIYAKARELRGQVSGEHGIGWAKRDYLRQSVEPGVMEVMRGIKRAFDPQGLLNPNKVCE